MVHVEHCPAKLKASPEGVQAFLETGIGLSVHWGLYSLLGRSEWAMHNESISMPAYEGLFDRFNPVRFDADEWAEMFKLEIFHLLILLILFRICKNGG